MFQPIGSVLKTNIQDKSLSRRLASLQLLEAFEAAIALVCDREVGGNVKPMYIKQKAVVIACLSPVYAQELILNKIAIFEAFKKICAEKYGYEPELEKIRFLF